jgi:oligopeptidase B
MIKLRRHLPVVAVLLLAACGGSAPVPPVAEAVPHRLELHGDVRIDDYYWLRDRDDPAVIAYLEAENAYADTVLGEVAELRETLLEEIRGRVPQSDSSVPVPDHGYLYYHRTEDGLAYPIHCRRKDEVGAPEEVLIDVNRVADGHGYCSVRGPEVSPDGRLMAWAADTVGRRFYTLRFTDLASGEPLPDQIPDVTGSLAWFNDGRALLYTRQDPETLRWFQVWRHVVGTDPAEDTLVYQEDDETFSVDVARTESGRYLVIDSQQTLASEVRVVDADDPTAEPVVVAPRERGVEYHVSHHGDRFLIRTNLDAPGFRIVEAPLDDPQRASWRDLVPHRDDVLVEGLEVFRDFLVLSLRRDGLARLAVADPATGEVRELAFDEPVHEVWVADNRVFAAPGFRFAYSSLTTPLSIFEVDVATGERSLLKRAEVLGGFDSADYVAERLMAPARDGVEVPISLVRRRDTPVDGTAPLLLHAYGAYGSSTDVDFDPDVVSLLDRGFVYAIAHVRGGQERGRWWYEDGRLLAKQNTFTDFVDSARYLIDRGFTSPDRLVARGRSAGGLLMGAVANMAPEQFAAIVAGVPFVDAVTTMLDGSIPLTTAEFDEWGDPRDPVHYDTMLSYSPYDNVAALDYPAIYVTTALHDSQVQYWEPAKWVAKLRALGAGQRPILLRTNMKAGHGGASDRYQAYRETAEEYAFILLAVGQGG